MMQQTTEVQIVQPEELSLLPKDDRSKKKKSSTTLEILKYGTCLLATLPTAALNGIAAVAGDSETLGSLKTVEDLSHLLENAEIPRIVFGGVAFLGSMAVFFFLNNRYLFNSLKSSLNLIRKDFLTLASKFCCKPLEDKDKAGLGENFLFIASICTSIIFAEIGGKALSFLGDAGFYSGFSVSLLVYFATRYASANFFFSELGDKNARLKKHYLGKLEYLPETLELTKDVEEVAELQDELSDFLISINQQWQRLPKDIKKIVLLKYVAPIMGYSLLTCTVIPIFNVFIPTSVEGTESLIHHEVGKSQHYQNIASIALGTFLTGLTALFYELNIKDLPQNFLKTAISIYENLKSGNYKLASKLLLLTVIAGGTSYLGSIGFGYVATSAIKNGYISYMGAALEQIIPDVMIIAVTSMLWAHLQELVFNTTKINITPIESEAMNVQKAKRLLEQADTKLNSSLIKSHASFFCSTPRETSSSGHYVLQDEHPELAINEAPKRNAEPSYCALM